MSSKPMSAGTGVLLSVSIVILAIAGCYIFSQVNTGVPQSNPEALAQCQAPYQQEENQANTSQQYSGAYNYNASATYQAMTDAANGLKACQDKYGN